MLYVDLPTRNEFEALAQAREEGCVSIYLPTTPITQQVTESRTTFGNLVKQAEKQLEAAAFDKRKLAALSDQLLDLADDDEFWDLQANSLAVFATSERLRHFRLANKLTATAQVSDRFHLKPLLRSTTFSQSAFVLALAENSCRVVEVSADLPARSVKLENLPKSAASAVRTANVNSRSPSGRIQGAEGQNVRLRQYARKVDAALRPLLAGRHTPLILAATGRLQPLFRSVCNYADLLENGIAQSPEQMNDQELADAARPILDDHYATQVEGIRALFERRLSQGRATSDIEQASRAATLGAVDTLLVDIDAVVPGQADEDSGAVTFSDHEGADSYGVVDEILRRTLLHGGTALGVRQEDLPASGALAAILRYAPVSS